MPETYEYEYIDRENRNTVCLGTFEKAPEDLNVLDTTPEQLIGRRFIVPTRMIDRESKLPIILTVKDVRCFHFLTENGYGSIATDLCFLETE